MISTIQNLQLIITDCICQYCKLRTTFTTLVFFEYKRFLPSGSGSSCEQPSNRTQQFYSVSREGYFSSKHIPIRYLPMISVSNNGMVRVGV